MISRACGNPVKKLFSEEGYGAHHIMQLKCLTLCTPPGLLGWVKRSDIELRRYV